MPVGEAAEEALPSAEEEATALLRLDLSLNGEEEEEEEDLSVY